MTDQEIVRALAEKVMGWGRQSPECAWMNVQVHPPVYAAPYFWNPLRSDEAACAAADKMATAMGYATPGYSWDGPRFKPETRYLTQEGFPLGTECWYVMIEVDGRREFVCVGGREPESRRRAICVAALKSVGAWEEPNSLPDREPASNSPSAAP